MPRARKHHVQTSMLDEHGRVRGPDGKPKGRGGKRPGAGRPPSGTRAGAPHERRPELKPRFPVHVVLRVARDLGNLRKRYMYKGLRAATITVAKRELHDDPKRAFRIVHISIQHDHVHMLVEAAHAVALSRGMQSFEISAAKQLNRAVSVRGLRRGTPAYALAMAKRRRGSVFPERYHEEIITTPKQARHALGYVLNNWRKHREDRATYSRAWKVDPFSTGVLFDGWKERADALTYMPYRDGYQPLVVYVPKTWLLCEGWRLHGLISFDHVPSAFEAAAPPRS